MVSEGGASNQVLAAPTCRLARRRHCRRGRRRRAERGQGEGAGTQTSVVRAAARRFQMRHKETDGVVVVPAGISLSASTARLNS